MNVFVVHTPFQAFAAQQMLARLQDHFHGHNRMVLVARDPEKVSIDRAVWTDVMLGPAELIGGFTPSRMRLGKSLALQAISGGLDEKATVLVSNIDVPVENALVTLARERPAELRMAVYPEGIGTLFPLTMRPRKRVKNAIKRVAGRIFATPYADYGNDFAGLEMAERIYSFVPGLPRKYLQKTVVIPAPAPPVAEPRAGWLVLGDSGAFLTARESQELALDMIAFVKAQAGGALLYKPHHHSKDRERMAFLQAGFELLADPRPVEQVFLESPIQNIISVVSSAVLHLKVFFGAQVRCVAFRPRSAILRSHDMSRSRYEAIRAAFLAHGVELVE